jgi:hypothetical protein
MRCPAKVGVSVASCTRGSPNRARKACTPAPAARIAEGRVFEKIKTDIAQDYYRQNFPNDGQRFVAWYVRNIHGQDANQARYCVTDGADDKQIDAIVLDDEQSVA